MYPKPTSDAVLDHDGISDIDLREKLGSALRKCRQLGDVHEVEVRLLFFFRVQEGKPMRNAD